MLVGGDRVLVAVSGGPDSMALLAVLRALAGNGEFELCAAHFNHLLRGAEGLRDQACAEHVAQRLGVPCVVGSATALPRGANLEARARAQRYDFLTAVGAARGCTKIATGHTVDDQAETVMMRLLRGSGRDGLAGIRPVRAGHIIRPLLDCSRHEVLAFLAAEGLPYCEDSSNREQRFLRNRVRHELMPVLRALTPAAVRRLATTAQVAGVESRWLDDHVRGLAAGMVAADGALSVVGLAQLPPALRGRAVREWLRSRRGDLRQISAAHVDALLALACGDRPNRQRRVPGGGCVRREYDVLRFAARAPQPATELEHVLLPGETVRLPSGWQLAAQLVSVVPRRVPVDLWTLVADADAVRAPLLVRGVRPGDRIQPFGMTGHRKLQDVFVDRKVPTGVRRHQAIIEADGEILWVPGVIRSASAPITAATRSTLRVIASDSGVAGR